MFKENTTQARILYNLSGKEMEIHMSKIEMKSMKTVNHRHTRKLYQTFTLYSIQLTIY